jgi:branched-chain amino acid aminotransferase
MSDFPITEAAAAFQVAEDVVRLPADERAAALAAPAFGTVFTDHMAHITWTNGAGWGERRIVAHEPLPLSPATAVLHYGQEIFEGMKAYRWEDGTIWTFRPEQNARRMNESAYRMALPPLPEDYFLGSIEALVRADADWVPSGEEQSLYLRPFMFASEPFLGVRAAHTVEYLVVASPVGAYFAGGVAPVSIWVETELHRAGPGGTGAAKCGGNYASSLLPQVQAAERGYEQVCFLDGRSATNLEELGGMNIMIVLDDGTLATPELTGSILPGVTRSSIIHLMNNSGHPVAERPISFAELREGLDSGKITEVFACGTAAVITPIGKLGWTDGEIQVGDGGPGELTMSIREELTGIQTGKVADRFGWMQRLV